MKAARNGAWATFAPIGFVAGVLTVILLVLIVR